MEREALLVDAVGSDQRKYVTVLGQAVINSRMVVFVASVLQLLHHRWLLLISIESIGLWVVGKTRGSDR